VTFWLCGPLGVITGLMVIRRTRSEKATREERQRLLLRSRRLRNIALAFMLFFWAVLFVQSVMMNYTNLAITHFEHSLAMCAPYLTIEEERAIRSQFALIKTRVDYEAVIRRLQAVAVQHNIALHEFLSW
jgi:hypothetical protein